MSQNMYGSGTKIWVVIYAWLSSALVACYHIELHTSVLVHVIILTFSIDLRN
jgi:hypothetical protein